LVVLNSNDDRRYVDGTDRLGTPGAVSAQMQKGVRSFTSAVLKPRQQAKRVSDLMGGDQFDWENSQRNTDTRLIN
jgi:hypothetical protein